MRGWLDDAWDATGGAVLDAAGDVTTSVIDRIPGGQGLREALHDVITGPVRDFANTAAGRVFFTALASTFAGSIAWTLGPQLASVAFAVPGLAAGDDFVDAYLQGLRDRAEQTAQIIGVPVLGDMFGTDVARALKKFAEEYAGSTVIETAEQIAKRLGIRVDSADFARAIWNRLPLPDPSRFSVTGDRLPPGQRSAVGVYPTPTQRYIMSYSNPLATQRKTTTGVEVGRALKIALGIQPTVPPAPASGERAVYVAPDAAGMGAWLGIGAAVVGVGALAWWAAGRK